MRVEVDICTKDRYENLAMLLWSLCEQTYTDWIVTIMDDSDNRKDIRELPYILPILKRLDKESHQWRVQFGSRRGPHYGHQLVLDIATAPYIFRVDDDCILDRLCLEELVKSWKELSIDKLAAIGPLVVEPSIPIEYSYLPIGYLSYKKFQGKVDQCGLCLGDNQWRFHPDDENQEVEHIYSSFLYDSEVARNIGGYNLDYNVVGHREETDFTYSMFLKGYKLFVNPKAIVWHLRNNTGGIRTYNSPNLWAECQEIYMKKFGFRTGKNRDKVVKIFGGLGDHLCATPLIRQLKKTSLAIIGYDSENPIYGRSENRSKLVISSVYNPIFAGNENVDELVYPNELDGYENIDDRHLYKWAFENSFSGKLSEAWCKMFEVLYDDDNLDYTIFPQEKEWAEKEIPNKNTSILISITSGIPVISYGDVNLVGSANPRTTIKNWFIERWVEVVKELNKMGFEVYQVGGIKDEIVPGCKRNFLGSDYRKTVALVDRCRTWISVDTFLQHAGHAVKKLGVVIFGPSNPDIFGHDTNINFFHPEVCVDRKCLQGNEDKFQWLSHAFNCENKKCMKSITVEEILNSLKEIL